MVYRMIPRIADEQKLLASVQTSLPPSRRVLVFAPHPDDEVFGCGGVLALLHGEGASISVIIVTDGAVGGENTDGKLSEIRAAESLAASHVLGIPEPTFWGMPDRGLIYGEELVERLKSAITVVDADLVLLPSPTEVHPDHQVLALAGAEAVRRLGGDLRALFFEINLPLPNPNLVIDITPVFEQKCSAMACFPSQLAEQPYDQRIVGLNRFRSYFLGPQIAAAEAYILLDPARLQSSGLVPLFEGPLAHRQQLGFSVGGEQLPLVSIVIRSMDRSSLSRTLDSLALQTWPNVEVVVVNAKGGTHSPLPERCGRFPLRMLGQGGALGRSRAANVGLAACSGRYLGFLDDDDTIDPDHLHHLVTALSSNGDHGLAYTCVRGIGDNPCEPAAIAEFCTPAVTFSRLLFGNLMPIHSVLFSSSLLGQGTGFDENLDLYEDWDFWLQLTRQSTPVFVNHISATYYASGTSGVGLGAGENCPLMQRSAEQLVAKWLPLLTPQEFISLGGLYRQSLEQAAGKDQQLAEKHQQLAEKDQQLAEKDQQLAVKDQQLAVKDQQLATLLTSRSWRITLPLRRCGTVARQGRAAGKALTSKVRRSGGIGAACLKASRILFAEGPTGLRDRLRVRPEQPDNQDDYQEWIRRYDMLTEKERSDLLEKMEQFCRKPLISVVMPVYNPSPCWLAEAIDSVRNQIYPHWELCIADDASTNPEVQSLLARYAKEDPRIKVCYRKKNGHISAASNSAFELASGEYVALLDHDDLLAELALFRVVEALQQHPMAGLLYSDEDNLDEMGVRCSPFFKPDWSPHLAISQAYLGHLVVMRCDILQQIGSFRTGLDGAQDYDLWLRASQEVDSIVHIPHLLYHWRKHPESTAASSAAKPYAHEAGRTAVAQYLQQRYPERGITVVDGEHLFTYQACFPLPEQLLVSIIIPTRDGLQLLQPCVESIVARSRWKRFEIIILDNGSSEPDTMDYLRDTPERDQRIRVVRADIPFNWSQLNNIGAQEARGDLLIFLNNDTLVISNDWLEQLAGYALLPDVGLVGGLLLFEDGSIQHSGVVVGMGGWADHLFRGDQALHHTSPFVSPVLTRNVLTVTGACMAISRERFRQLGGFDETFTICGSDVELGLRAHRQGFYNVLCAEARLYHLESKTRTSFIPEQDFQQSALAYEPFRTQQCDPFYNPNLSLAGTTPRVQV